MERRSFIYNSALAALFVHSGGGMPAMPHRGVVEKVIERNGRLMAQEIEAVDKTYPAGKRVPLGWPVFVVPLEGKPALLVFPRFTEGNGPLYLRITAAIDFREEKRVGVYLGQSGVFLGEMQMIYAHPFQPFELEIDPKHAKGISSQGITLKLTAGSGDAWFYSREEERKDNTGLQPHLLVRDTPSKEKAFLDNLYSMNSFSPFGWMGGSVQDALYELAILGDKKAEETLKHHLNQYLNDIIGVRFEDPHTVAIDGNFNSTEDFPAFVSIVNYFPQHVVINQAIAYIKEKTFGQRGLTDKASFTTEGCYTLVYPMLGIGLQRNDKEMIKFGLQQLFYRMQYLTDDNAIYQRGTVTGEKAYRNWGRGVVWYLLGVVKSLRLLQDTPFQSMEEVLALKNSFITLAAMVREHQDDKGMWRGYLHVASSAVDTSATAGIAAALVWGVSLGWLDSSYISTGQRAYDGLLDYLTPDGFLKSVSQINRGGEELQRSDYRVISQFGMGLMAQLKAALNQV